MTGIIGKKLGMTRIIQDDGTIVPITVIQCDPNIVAQIKNQEKDGYSAIVLGFSSLRKPTKTKKFHVLKEFRVDDDHEFKKGDSMTIEIFQEGELVRVTGTSKGKGFQGVMKRHNMSGGPGSHGSHFKREPGSVGARAKPGKIHRGKKLPGHMGAQTITLLNLPIAYVDKEKNLIGIKGSLPGSNNSIVTITKLS